MSEHSVYRARYIRLLRAKGIDAGASQRDDSARTNAGIRLKELPMPRAVHRFDREKDIDVGITLAVVAKTTNSVGNGSFQRAHGAAAGSSVGRRGTWRHESPRAALGSVGRPLIQAAG